MADREAEGTITRRGVVATGLMFIGLVAGYGLGALHFFRYLIPIQRKEGLRELFIGTIESIPVGSSLTVKDLRGQEINVARTEADPEHPEQGFRALSSTCPHLGCKVHWDPSNGQFICPCHQGIFTKDGVAIAGPPAKESQNLPTYPVKVNAETGWVFVMVPQEQRYGL